MSASRLADDSSACVPVRACLPSGLGLHPERAYQMRAREASKQWSYSGLPIGLLADNARPTCRSRRGPLADTARPAPGARKAGAREA